MNVVLREPWTVDRFLAWEDRQEGRHEFDGTRIVEMTGGARNHQRIVLNLAFALLSRLDPARFDVIQEMRIVIGNRVRYPDVTVTVGQVAGDLKTLRDALAVFEVLSDETAGTDLGTKKDEYRLIPSIREYVLVAQDRREVRVLVREAGGWVESRVEGGIELAGTGVSISVAEIYRGVRF